MRIMTEKPVIVHVIDDLGRGGAETLLVDLLKDLQYYYTIVLVTLTDYSEFDALEVKCAYRYSLGYKGKLSLPRTIKRLRKIIRKHRPVLVRSQLYWSTIVARFACPRNIPLVFSVHVTLSDGSFTFTRKGAILKWLEKRTYKSRHFLVGVTQEVIDDYDKTIGIRGTHYVLHNFVNDAYFANDVEYIFPVNGKLRMVAVGNPKKQKNYELLLRALRVLNDHSVSCDIYGSSSYNVQLQEEIDKYKLPVCLKGKSAVVYEQLKNYDAFIMSSHFEGFGIAVAEAMAVGLPLFLSGIKVLKEVSHNNAIFFDPSDEKELAGKILDFKAGVYDAKTMSVEGKKISSDNYSKKAYLLKLVEIYRQCIVANQ